MANTSFWTFVVENPVKIPIMQRDYAQGRTSKKIERIRDVFLGAIFSALKNRQSLTLDFVYGYKREKEDNFYPLDGQQRLTTLYLLHWYIAAREGHIDSAKEILKRFSYETRHSSRVFCLELSKYCPNVFSENLDEHITNESWFMQSWEHDATISSMLTMLRDIHKFYNDYGISRVWDQLTSQEECLINFHLLPMDNFGLSDELYIKMNSRGKELTEFENFKAQFSEGLAEEDKKTFTARIDGAWSDLFWDLYKDGEGDIAQTVDSAFMRFFDYAESIIEKNDHKRLFMWLDMFVDLHKNNPAFFDEHFYYNETYEEGKVRLFFGEREKEVNLFKGCADSFSTNKSKNSFNFSIGQQLMLYACILHLEAGTKNFKIRIRQLRNLVANSPDTLRDEFRPALLAATEKVIVTGNLTDLENIEGRHFNTRQIKEEIEKEIYVDKMELYSTLCQLEDNRLLRGCIAPINFLDTKNFQTRAVAFLRLFDSGCNYDLISRALVTYGDYSQQERNGRLRFGNNDDGIWRDIITPSSRRTGYEDNLRPAMEGLLDFIDTSDDIAIKLEKRVSDYIADKIKKRGYDRSYYFIKYPDFRSTTELGYYIWENEYEALKLNRIALNGRHWDPFLLAARTVSEKGDIGAYDDPLIIGTVIIKNINEGFIFSGDDKILDNAVSEGLLSKTDQGYFLPVFQDNEIDIEDRIEKCAAVIHMLFSKE